MNSIIDVLFIRPNDKSDSLSLISISSDRSIVEYNLKDINIQDGLVILVNIYLN